MVRYSFDSAFKLCHFIFDKIALILIRTSALLNWICYLIWMLRLFSSYKCVKRVAKSQSHCWQLLLGLEMELEGQLAISQFLMKLSMLPVVVARGEYSHHLVSRPSRSFHWMKRGGVIALCCLSLIC